MTKAIDETWTLRDHADGVAVVDTADGTQAMFEGDNEEGDLARARLAACAPEMARMLLAREWDSEDCCASCGAVRILSGPSPRAEHIEDCAYVALMKKAGLR